ncbi:uncharacterized protein EV154DRAFT_479278 [Mucor mucedo]|uniref:uncharacterized protein n=1 Tax=Mucor mucedo TaxID=29922 RepID=UPI00221FA1D2|nr:uncharacterized protein EV154DRAFT_479278 [Mucor mucedo]KAI7893526.1 hypothetical protein EV154DRAFT_479278 [Mucor mucedo]
MYENSTGTSNAAIARLNGVLPVSTSDDSIKVAGETFFVKQIKDIEKKQEKVLDEIRQTIPNFVSHAYADLSTETAQLSIGLWEDFVQRKKLLFKGCYIWKPTSFQVQSLQVNITRPLESNENSWMTSWTYTTRNFATEIFIIKEGITTATFLDGRSPFSDIDLHPMTEPWLCGRNDNEKIKLLKLKQGNKWRSHSMRYLMLIGVSPPINFASEPQSDTASLLDPIVACEDEDVDDEEDVALVFKVNKLKNYGLFSSWINKRPYFQTCS